MQFLKFFVPFYVCVARRAQQRAEVLMSDSATNCPAGVETATMQYTRAMVREPITNEMPQCAFWSIDDVGKKVADECCDATKFPAGADASTDAEPDSRLRNGGWVNCYVRERAAGGSWIRNFVGCEDGQLVTAESCEPEGVGSEPGDLDTYPMTNETFADAQNVNGSWAGCGCELPAKYLGEGCFAALNSKAFNIPGANDMVNYVKVVLGDTPYDGTWRKRDRPVEEDFTVRHWSVPEDPLMQYYFTLRENFYNEANYDDTTAFTAGSNPECDLPWGDLDDDGTQNYNLLGSKLPDSCCSDLIKLPAEQFKDPQGNQATCYLHAFSNWPKEGDSKWMRLYLGCEDGELVAAENCVPDGTQFYTKDTMLDGTFTYPMDKTVADSTWKNSTPAGCNCDTEAAMNNGPGCYLAAATALDYQQKFLADSDTRGIVFVKIGGTCSA